MRIKNNKKKYNYVNYKVGGIAKKALIQAGSIIDLPFLKSFSQILNVKDFNLGFLEVVEDIETPNLKNKTLKEKEDVL